MDFIFNEMLYVENLIKKGTFKTNKFGDLINKIVRYNYFVKNMDDKENINQTTMWLQVHCKNFVHRDYVDVIENAVVNCKDYPMRKIDSVCLYNSEISTICSLKDIRKEKLLFSMLCIAKYQNLWFGYKNGKINVSITDMFKCARVNIPSYDKDKMLHELYECGLIGVSYKVDGTEIYVNILSNGDNDEINKDIGLLYENDYKELAYLYLNWKNHGGYIKCKRESCGRLFKEKGNYELCPLCRKYQPTGEKTIRCIRCGQDVVVDSRNTTKCRCEDCQKEVDREKNRLRVQRYRKNHKM